MQLSKNSWHYKLHHIIWGESARDPNNLCPYFWKTIMFGGLLFIIFGPLCIPFWIAGRIANKVQEDTWPLVTDEGLASAYIFMAILFNCFLWVVFCMIYMWFTPLTTKGVAPIGIVGWLTVIFFLVRWGWLAWLEKRRDRKQVIPRIEDVKQPEPNPIIEYIKAWYKRNCPMIKWRD